ncbi:MFS transporter [Sphingomonas oryzagri]|uniref:MFS transporter n=1 Tax=Sphingomonas oryzagri TaxID=3042314 RepID=A0ABT6N082_9SPHN|nr:MFS transporter [Sphingomonas oryzagri]MDH7637731.1 MFS transporter [Sphingomonas oryzagri]
MATDVLKTDISSPPSEWSWSNIRLVIACHVGLAASLSPAFLSTYGLFLKPMATGSGWSRADVAIALTIVSIIETPLLPVVGVAVDRWGARGMVLLAMIGLPISLALLAWAPPSHSAYMAASVVLGCIAAAASPCAYLRLLSSRFDRSLGLAIAIAVSGMGTGQMVNAFIIGKLIHAVGWREGLYWLAVLTAIVGVIAYLMVPWGQIKQREQAAPKALRTSLLKMEYLRQTSFWTLTVAFTLVLLVMAGVQINVAAALSDKGLGYLAATAIATIGMASMVSRFLGGVLLDRIPAHWLGGTLFLLQAVGCILLAFVHWPSASLVAVFLVSFAYGAETDILPFFIRKLYNVEYFGSIFGFMFGVAHLGLIVGPVLVARCYDVWHNYVLAFLIMASLSTIAAILIVVTVKLNEKAGRLL